MIALFNLEGSDTNKETPLSSFTQLKMSDYPTYEGVNGIHLVGSIPFSSNTEAFSKTLAALPNRLRRIPDGETGKRNYFIRFQDSVFIRSPFIMYPHDLAGTPFQGQDFSASKGTKIELGPTGYEDAALASYTEFLRLRTEGIIEPGMRFQVCLPTPVNVLTKWVRPEYQVEVEPVYEAQLLKDIRQIQDSIPARDLAIQFDCAVEFAMLEGLGKFFTPWFAPVREGIVERIVRLTGAVDDDVQLGIHLCYGSINNQHFVQPKDSGHLVEMANVLTREITRPIQWIHMPVPKDRTDTMYFEPMKGLALWKETELYLGLIHANDMQGTLERMSTAREVISQDFGVGTWCGMGRTPADQIDGILEIAAAVSRPI